MQAGARELDTTDRQIIDLLVEDARRTFGDIGARVALSAPAVKRRVDRLQALGVIRGYTAVLDYQQLGWPVEAFTEIRFEGHLPVAAFEQLAREIPEVARMWTTAGDPDAIALIRARDVADLRRVVDRIRRTGTVAGTKTLMVLGSYGGDEQPSSPIP